MKRTIFKIVISLFLVLFSIQANAQQNYTVTILMPPPGTLNTSDFYNVTVTNNSGSDQSGYLSGSAKEENDGMIVKGTTVPMLFKKGVNNIKIKDLPKTPDVEYLASNPKYKESLIRQGKFPSGNYEICVKVISAGSNEELGSDCINQEVLETGLLTLMSPADGENIDSKVPVTFTWSSGGKIPEGGYTLKICEVMNNQTPEIAMKSNKAFFEQEGLRSSTFTYPNSGKGFEDGKIYTWMVSSVAINSEVYTFIGTNSVEKSVLSQYINIEDACTHAPLANWPVKSGCASQNWMNYTDNNGDISFNDPNNSCISITRHVLLNGATSVTPTGNIRYVTAPFVVDFKINGRLVSTSSSFDNVNYNGTGTIPLVNMTTYSTSLQYKVTLYKAPPPSYTATTVVWTYPWNSTFPTGIPTGGMNLPTTPDGLRYIIKLEAKNNCGNIKTITGGFTYNSAAPPINICPNSIMINGGFLNGAVAGNMLLSNARVDNWKRYANSVFVRNTMGCSDLNYITVYGGSNSRSAIYQNTVSVIPGRTYTIKFCGKLSSNSLASTGYLKFYKNSETAANLIGISPVITSKTNWNNFTLPNWVAPAGVNKIIISGYNTITTRANIDLDNICVEDVSMPSNTTEGNCIDSYSFGWQYDVNTGTLTFSFLSTDLNSIPRQFEIAKVPNCWWAPNCTKVDESCPWFNSTARQNLFNGIPNYSNSTYNGPGNGWTNPIVNGNTIVTPGDNFETGSAIIGNPINSFHNVGYWYILRIKCPDGSNSTWQTFLLSECTQ